MISNTGLHTLMLNSSDSFGTIKVDLLSLKKSAMVLRAINHKLRQQIVRLLDEKKKLTVTDVYITMRLEQSVASQHLAILRRAGIVITQREGKFIYYAVNHKRLLEINKFAEELIA
jgi:DNA-binding transcriptional ArsR family regulator